jgi:hypothetical protein
VTSNHRRLSPALTAGSGAGVVSGLLPNMAHYFRPKFAPVCEEVLAPNSTVLTRAQLESVCRQANLYNVTLDKKKLKTLMRAFNEWYRVG